MTKINYSVSRVTDFFESQSGENSPQNRNSQGIAVLNDRFRYTMGLILVKALHQNLPKLNISVGVQSLPPITIELIGRAIREFNDFTEGNDPYREHDFGKIVVESHEIFWKIEYYDLSMNYQSPDPSDSLVTKRIMSVMLCEEY